MQEGHSEEGTERIVLKESKDCKERTTALSSDWEMKEHSLK